VFGIAVVVIAIMALSNPSEDKQLDRFVATAQAWQAEHVQSCSYCDSVTDADELRMIATSKFDEGGIMLGEGLRRKNYLVFSVLTREGLADAATVGILGCVFGPTFPTPYPCPEENRVALPEAHSASEFAATFSFTVLADGSLMHDGAPVTRDELESRLNAIANNATTMVTIKFSPGTKFQTVNEVAKWASSLGFAVGLSETVETTAAERAETAGSGEQE
jgi:hypothetical protein